MRRQVALCAGQAGFSSTCSRFVRPRLAVRTERVSCSVFQEFCWNVRTPFYARYSIEKVLKLSSDATKDGN